MTYLNHPTPWRQQRSQRPSVWLSRLSAFCACVRWCVLHIWPWPCSVCAHSLGFGSTVCIHSSTSTESSTCGLLCTASCTAVTENYPPSKTFMCQSAVSQTKKHLKERLASVYITVLFLFFLSVCIARERCGTDWAGQREQRKPHSLHGQMLTVLAWSYAWVSD